MERRSVITYVNLPKRTYEDDVFFSSDEDAVNLAELQDVRLKAAFYDVIHKEGFRVFVLTYKDKFGTVNDYYLSHSTRKDVDWQLTRVEGEEPVYHNNYYNVNDDVTSYDRWPSETMAALYNELKDLTPKEGAQLIVVTLAA